MSFLISLYLFEIVVYRLRNKHCMTKLYSIILTVSLIIACNRSMMFIFKYVFRYFLGGRFGHLG